MDASNAINAHNSLTAIVNIQRLCPALATPVINTYRALSGLFMDCNVLLSQERTTQRDPLAKPTYALAKIPLITMFKLQVPQVNQVCYADDRTGSNEIVRLRK